MSIRVLIDLESEKSGKISREITRKFSVQEVPRLSKAGAVQRRTGGESTLERYLCSEKASFHGLSMVYPQITRSSL
jgi:hypothetical protein